VSYFAARPDHSLFVRAAKVQKIQDRKHVLRRFYVEQFDGTLVVKQRCRGGATNRAEGPSS
jgi:hypothetical protein